MTARLVLPPDAPREEWLTARRQGVTASEIAVILGISPFDSPFNLYYKKRGEISEDFDNDAMSLGRHLEPWIADRWAEDHPEFAVSLAGLFVSSERSWQMATPDRILYAAERRALLVDDAVALLEIKSSGTYDGWGEDGSDEIPSYYRAQVLWQLDTLGLTEAHVTCLFLSSRSIRNYRVPYDAGDVELMRDAAVEFLARIENGEPPAIDHTPATTSALKQLHPDLDEDAEAEIKPDLASDFRYAKASLDDAKAHYDLLTNQVRAEMGDAKRAVCDGKPVATRSKYTVAEHVRKATTVDKITPARAKKDKP